MAVSDISICNGALRLLGARRISAFTENTPESRVCAELYEKIRDDLLYSHPWNFASARVSLAALTSSPAFKYAYQFQLPNDCLRVLGTECETDEYEVEGRYLVTDNSTMSVLYIKRITDPGLFSPGFVATFEARLAMEMAYDLTKSTSLKDAMTKEYKDKLANARSFDAQEGSPRRVYADSWINSRR